MRTPLHHEPMLELAVAVGLERLLFMHGVEVRAPAPTPHPVMAFRQRRERIPCLGPERPDRQLPDVHLDHDLSVRPYPDDLRPEVRSHTSRRVRRARPDPRTGSPPAPLPPRERSTGLRA